MVFLRTLSFIFIYYLDPSDFTLSLWFAFCVSLYNHSLEAFAPLYIFFLAFTVARLDLAPLSLSLCVHYNFPY